MDHKNNKVMPWVTLAASAVYSVAYVLMIISFTVETDRTVMLILALITMAFSIVVITLSVITYKINKINDPMHERTESLCGRYVMFAVVTSVIPIFFEVILMALIPEFDSFVENEPARAAFLITILTLYVTGFPLLLLSLRKLPKMKIEKRNPTLPFFLMCITVMSGLCLIGTLIGFPIETALTLPFQNGNESSTSDIAQILENSSFFDRVLVIGIMAPVFEELIFRKLLIERTIKYGETFSILLSGFMFGLFHGNFQQFFFASFVGMLFAFVFIRTGKIIYPILLHMTVNLSTSVVTSTLYIKLMPYLDNLDDYGDFERLPTDMQLLFMVLVMWMLFLCMTAVTGIVLLAVFNKRFKPYKTPDEPSLGKIIGNCASSPLFLSFVILCLSQFGSAYLPDIVDFFI